MTKRSVRVTREQNEEAKKLLRLIGVPVIEAPTEAEAQCAELCRGGKVWAAGSEDMDTLTFGTPRMVRHLTFSEARKVRGGAGSVVDRIVCLLRGPGRNEPLSDCLCSLSAAHH